MVEQRLDKALVTGSIPVEATNSKVCFVVKKITIEKAKKLLSMNHVVTDDDVSAPDFKELEKEYRKVYLPFLDGSGQTYFFNAVVSDEVKHLYLER